MSAPALVPVVCLAAGLWAGALAAVPVDVACALAVEAWIAAVALRDRPAWTFVSACACGFAAAGLAMGAAADREARRPPLVVEHARRSAAGGDPGAPQRVEGRLREDAAATPYGASLWIDVETIDGRPARGGARIAVGGALAAGARREWRAGRAVRLSASLRLPHGYRDPGLPDEERSLARRGIALVGSCKSAALVEVAARGSWLDEAAAETRAHVRAAVADAVGPWSARSAAIVTAILIGDRAGLDEPLERRLQEAGTYHVIAISGGNIAILAGLLLVALHALRLPWRLVAIVVALLLAVYAEVAGGGASVARATLAAVAYLAARLIDLRPPAVNVLAVAALVLLAWAPLGVFDGGLALSFGATLGILLGVRRLVRPARRRLWTAPLELLAATAAAEAALAPVSAALFSRVSAAGLLLNFLAIPLMTVVQISGLALVALRAADASLAAGAGCLAHLAATALVASTALLDAAPWLAWRVTPPSIWLIGAYYAAWIGCLTLRRPSRRRAAALGLVALVVVMLRPAAIFPTSAPAPFAAPARWLRVGFLDVGQGDAILVDFPSGHVLLVDAGGAAGSRFDVGDRVVLPAVRALGVGRIDYFALTHADPDHAGGAPAVLRELRPREVWEGVPVPPFEPLAALAAQAASTGALWRTLQAGDAARLGGATLEVWHPPPPDWERQRVRNDDSLVLDIRLGRVSILLTGDIGHDVERRLLARLPFDGIRVLKAPHHGSAGSSGAAFVAAAHPAVVVFSAGRDNRYGHPAPVVVRRYEEAGAAVFRTDRDGMVMVLTDGHDVRVETFMGRRAMFWTR